MLSLIFSSCRAGASGHARRERAAAQPDGEVTHADIKHLPSRLDTPCTGRY